LTEKRFGPNEYVTREQLGTMLFRFSSTAPVSVPERADLTPFADDEKVSDWSEEAMRWAVEAGLIKGTDGNRLLPGGFATREQFTAIIERYDNTFKLAYNRPVVRSHYTEPEYPLVKDADFYVSTTGSDENEGSFEHPFATFEKAVEAVRGVPKTAEKGCVKVAFMAGRYGSVHLDLTEVDSGTPECPVIYCKYGDGDVVFDSGVTIPESAFEELAEDEKAMFTEKAAAKIKKVDLNSFYDEIPAYDDFVLYGDGTIQNVARYPNRWEDGSDHFMKSGRTNDKVSLLITNRVIAGKIAKCTEEEISEMRIYGYIIRGYRKDVFRTASFDPDTGVLMIANPETSEFHEMREGWQGVDGVGIELSILNIPRELDFTHEYWIDRSTGTLYIYDPRGDYRVPGGKGEKILRGDPYDAGDGLPPVPEYVVIDARNVGYITLLGLDFENAAGGFIFGYKTSGITLDRCSFSYSTGRNHMLFEYSLDGAPMDLTIKNSEFDYSVGCAVYVMDVATGPERYTNISNVTVDNCLFSHTNLEYDVEGACNLFKCTKGVISHCDFVECHRYAVQFDYSCDVVV
ncbi:MAG: S-layer homology domain-containing protein, partial [Clostridia bacterium]|nr:S-layer homology domain-containing protein [Clostridia bacterium]